MTSALLSVIVPLCAYGIVRELASGRRRDAVGAGLLVAFEPMFGFISGAVNNDVGVNSSVALLLYLFMRALRRGLTLRLALAIGVVTGVTPLMKGTGYEVYPAAAVGVAMIVFRDASGLRRALRDGARRISGALRRRLIYVASGFGALAAVSLSWSGVAPSFHRTAIATPGGVSPVTTVATGSQFGAHVEYIWETFFPRLPFMVDHWHRSWPFFDIYVRRGFAGFGWYTFFFNPWVYTVIVVVIALATAGVFAGLIRFRAQLLVRWRELLFLTLAVTGVFAGVQFAYFADTPRTLGLAEQGRYGFPAIAALAALAVFATRGAGRRLAAYALVTLVMLMIGLNMASHLLYLTTSYT